MPTIKKEPKMGKGLLPDDAMYLVSIEKAESVDWNKPEASCAFKFILSVEGMVEGTSTEPFDDWMGDVKLFDQVYVPVEGTKWRRYPVDKLGVLAEAIGVDYSTPEEIVIDEFTNGSCIIKIKNTVGKWEKDAAKGTKKWIDAKTEIAKYYPLSIMED